MPERVVETVLLPRELYQLDPGDAFASERHAEPQLVGAGVDDEHRARLAGGAGNIRRKSDRQPGEGNDGRDQTAAKLHGLNTTRVREPAR